MRELDELKAEVERLKEREAKWRKLDKMEHGLIDYLWDNCENATVAQRAIEVNIPIAKLRSELMEKREGEDG